MLTVAPSAPWSTLIGTHWLLLNALDRPRYGLHTYFNQAMVLVMVLGRLVTGGWAVRHTFPDGNPLHADADGDAFPRNMDYGLARWSFEDLRWMILIGSAISMAFAPIVLLMPSVPPPISKKTMSEETEASTSIWETCRRGHLLIALARPVLRRGRRPRHLLAGLQSRACGWTRSRCGARSSSGCSSPCVRAPSSCRVGRPPILYADRDRRALLHRHLDGALRAGDVAASRLLRLAG